MGISSVKYPIYQLPSEISALIPYVIVTDYSNKLLFQADTEIYLFFKAHYHMQYHILFISYNRSTISILFPG